MMELYAEAAGIQRIKHNNALCKIQEPPERNGKRAVTTTHIPLLFPFFCVETQVPASVREQKDLVGLIPIPYCALAAC